MFRLDGKLLSWRLRWPPGPQRRSLPGREHPWVLRAGIPDHSEYDTTRLGVGFRLLGNDVDVDGGRLAEEAMYCGKIKILAPVANGGAAENDLGYVFAADELSDGVGNAAAL